MPKGGVGLSQFLMDVEKFEFGLECVGNCTSPGILEVQRRANAPTASAELTVALNDLIDTFEGKCAVFLNVHLEALASLPMFQSVMNRNYLGKHHPSCFVLR